MSTNFFVGMKWKMALGKIRIFSRLLRIRPEGFSKRSRLPDSGYRGHRNKGLALNESALSQGAPRGAYEIAQHGDVGAVGPDSSRVDRKSEAFSEIQVDAGVIQLRKTESLRGKHAIASRRINRAGGTVMPPGTAGHLVELLPIGFVPGRHTIS